MDLTTINFVISGKGAAMIHRKFSQGTIGNKLLPLLDTFETGQILDLMHWRK